MKRFVFLTIPLFLALGVFFTIAFFLTKNTGKGALQVTANPKSKVYINGKFIGETPLCKCEAQDMLSVGEYNIRIDPQDSALTPFEEKITIAKSILTVVDRTFGKGVTSEGSIISLTPLENKKDIQLLVISFPDTAHVLVDSSIMGSTPILQKNLTESDHEVTIKKDGYREKTIRIRTVAGYKLTVVAYLGVSLAAAVTPTPSPLMPTISPTAALVKVLILQTPTGFLRVRDSGSSAGLEIARVNPGETYELAQEGQDWYRIKLPNGQTGWISSQYAKKQ